MKIAGEKNTRSLTLKDNVLLFENRITRIVTAVGIISYAALRSGSPALKSLDRRSWYLQPKLSFP
jgi:hypothetical protein